MFSSISESWWWYRLKFQRSYSRSSRQNVCWCVYVSVVYYTMHTYIHMYIHTYILYVHAYVHTYLHTYTYIHTYIHRSVHMHICTYISTHILCIHTYIHTNIYTYVHTYIHACIHTYIKTYIHTNMHMYIRTSYTPTHTRDGTKCTNCTANQQTAGKLHISPAWGEQRTHLTLQHIVCVGCWGGGGGLST